MTGILAGVEHDSHWQPKDYLYVVASGVSRSKNG